MAELKTKPTDGDVEKYLNGVGDPQKRADSFELLALMKKISGEQPVLWGQSIIGFGKYHYKSSRSKQEGDWPLTGFSPRKQYLVVYIMPGFGKYQEVLGRLGKFKTSMSCLYFNKLADIHLEVLVELVRKSLDEMRKKYL